MNNVFARLIAPCLVLVLYASPVRATNSPLTWAEQQISAKTNVVAVFYSSCTGVITSNVTIFFINFGSTSISCSGVSSSGGMIVTHDMTIGSLRVKAGSGGVNSSSGVVTILKNGSSTGITCTLGTSTSCSDTTHSASVVAGDLITISGTSQLIDTLANVSLAFEGWI